MKTLRNWYLQIPIVLLFILGQTVYAGVSYFPSQGGASVSGTNTWTGTNDWNGTSNFTTPLTVYQTTTHSGTAWIGLTQTGAGTSNVAMGGAGTLNFVYGAGTTYTFSNTNATGFSLTGPDIRMLDGSNANPVIFNREAIGVLQLGQDVNGAAVNQTIKGHDGITGTDILGASLTLSPGRGTGAANSGSIILNRDLRAATGTTAQTQAPSYISCPSKILSNTSATVQAIATITTTSTTAGAIKVFFTSVASNGTLLDADAGEVYVAWNNNAGTVAATASATVGSANSVASGTLTTLPTVTVATNVVTVNYTPTWTVIVPTVVTGYATFEVNGVNSVSCQ